MSYIVYWAHLSEHIDPYSEGYVGISMNGLEERKRSHYKTARSSARRNVHFHNALLKYKDKVIWEILHDNLAEEAAYSLEEKYRYKINIGWNTDKGGVKAVSPEWYADEANKEKHRQATSDATRQRIAEVDSSEARAARARKVWSNEEYRKSRDGMFSGSNNPQYGKFGKDHPAAGHAKTSAGRAAISAAMSGRYVGSETRDKIAKARSKVTDSVRDEMYRRRMNGEQPKKIAEHFNCTPEYVVKQVRYWRKKNDLPEPPSIVDWDISEAEMKRIKARGEKAIASKFSDIQRAEICERRAQGESYKSIGKTFGKGFSTIANICKTWGPQNGYPFTKINGQRDQTFTKEQKTEICRRRINGETFSAIAKDFGATIQNVHSICSSWGPENGFSFKKTNKKK